MATKKEKSAEVAVQEINTGTIDVWVIGRTPLILNRMSEKAWRELLLPAPPKNRASRAAALKHEPLAEYRASVYRDRDENGPTAIMLPVTAFKGAAMTAALDLPGSSKSQVGRLIWVQGAFVPVWGLPELSMMIVRQADIKRTPDVRTRAVIREWCTRFTVEFVQPIIKAQSVVNLFAAGGMTAGVGDFRQEKGKGNYGQFQVVDPNDERVVALMERGDRAAQEKALDEPKAYDDETAELLSWFSAEVNRRGFKVAS